MANVQHSTLTGSDLHESKGAATAASGQVAIANGAGGAPFGVLSYTQLSNTPLPKLQLNGATSTGQAIIKVYTTTSSASDGTWSVVPSGFTTVWAAHATAIGGNAVGTACTADIAVVSAGAVSGIAIQHNSAANVFAASKVIQVTVIGV